ncbi:hypothetical protein [Falsiroseomonas sp. E2-1-a4]|uniref:hypothetical protein n=1 Tax=Falsiroseomonas sp. E2-1-a4 TaxID=3239299 RepID=UPI003F3D6A48
MLTQPLGWLKNPITSVDQLRGLRYRTVGLATDLFNAMGAAVTALPGGEIVPALERGVIDGAEFNNPSSDRILGNPDGAKSYMIQSFYQSCIADRALLGYLVVKKSRARPSTPLRVALGNPASRARGGILDL